ncbi:MAG: DNA-binding domain-containing protein [Nannocystaceae bacterium]|nr:DNA-binding domain-containing protein [Nannocystaceae bacterium]
MTLQETQALLWAAIRWPTGVEDFLAQSDVKTRRVFAQTFAQTPTLGRVPRVQIYAEAYFWRLYEVAADQYPVTAWLAGPPAFHDFVTDFVLAHPSRTPDIRRFAAGIADMLCSHALGHAQPGLAQVAAVDWAISDALDMADEDRLGPATLESVPPRSWPCARFGLTKTAQLLPCSLPYSVLRRAWADEQPVPAFEESKRTVLVWRQADNDVFQRTLGVAEARALGALAAGNTFAQACDAAAGREATDASPADVAHWLRRWLDDDLFVSVDYSS